MSTVPQYMSVRTREPRQFYQAGIQEKGKQQVSWKTLELIELGVL